MSSRERDMEGRVALVFGGTKGIGRAIALELAAAGATVTVQGRDRDAAAEVVEELERRAGRGAFAPGDLYDYADVRRVVDETAATQGGLDVVVANGGSGQPKAKLLDDVDPEEIPRYFESRVYQRIYAIHAAYPHMKRAGYGKLLSITTEAGRTPTPAEALVGAAASSLVFMTRALGRELARHGVRINTICTTLTSGTPPYERYTGERDRGSDAVIVKAFKKIEEVTPFGINTPDDIAHLARFLASPQSDQISGATVSVSAGLSFP